MCNRTTCYLLRIFSKSSRRLLPKHPSRLPLGCIEVRSRRQTKVLILCRIRVNQDYLRLPPMTRPKRLCSHQEYHRSECTLRSRNRLHCCHRQSVPNRVPLLDHFRLFRKSSTQPTHTAGTVFRTTRHHLMRRREIHLQSLAEGFGHPQSKASTYRIHIRLPPSRELFLPHAKNHPKHHLGKKSLSSRQHLHCSLVMSLSSFQGKQTVVTQGHKHLACCENLWIRIRGECLRLSNPGARTTNPRGSRRPRTKMPRCSQITELYIRFVNPPGYELIACIGNGGQVHTKPSQLVTRDWREREVRTIGDVDDQVINWRDLWLGQGRRLYTGKSLSNKTGFRLLLIVQMYAQSQNSCHKSRNSNHIAPHVS